MRASAFHPTPNPSPLGSTGPSRASIRFLRRPLLAVSVLLVVAAGGPTRGAADHGGAAADESCPQHAQHADAAAGGDRRAAAGLAETGEAAFAAIGEVAAALAADPSTDWRRVDLDRLRDHLLDMHRVMVGATIERRDVAGGLEATLRGDPPTRGAIGRMLPAHGAMMDGHRGWLVSVRPDGAAWSLRITSSDPEETARIRGLGVAGFLVAGDHHRPHHLMIARGLSPHHRADADVPEGTACGSP